MSWLWWICGRFNEVRAARARAAEARFKARAEKFFRRIKRRAAS